MYRPLGGYLVTTLSRERNNMAKERKVPLRKDTPVSQILKVTKSDGQRGAPFPKIQKVPQQQPGLAMVLGQEWALVPAPQVSLSK